MTTDWRLLTIKETAHTLGVSTRHARRLADSGAVSRVARGVVARDSVDRYINSQHQGRTRAWAEHTAWAAVAILTGRNPAWLGATQSSRLRKTLREITEANDLLARMRDRAQTRCFEGHRAALPRLREAVVLSDIGTLGVAAATADDIDGYLAASELDQVVHSFGLRESVTGRVTLRVTGFDFDRVRELVGTSAVAALDAATSADPRLRGVGHRTLDDLLNAYQ